MKADNVTRARNIMLALANDGFSAGDMADVIANTNVMCADTMCVAVPEIGGPLHALALLIQQTLERHCETRDLESEIHVINQATVADGEDSVH